MNISNKIDRLKSVLIISMYFPPEIIGGSTGAWNRGIIFQNIGFSVYFLCGFPSYPTGKVSDSKYKGKLFYVEKIDNFTVIRVRLISLSHSGLVKRFVLFINFIIITILFMPRILKITGELDIVYSRAPILFSAFIGSIYARYCKAFFILEMPDIWPDQLVFVKTKSSLIITPIGKLIANLAYRLPDVIITIGNRAVDLIVKNYNPKKPVYGLLIGADINKFPSYIKKNSRDELIRNGILPPELSNKFVVLYSGLISKAQQVENLAYAAEKLKSESEIVFVIIGEGEQKLALKQLRDDMNLKNFYLLPSQPRNLMPIIISSADICAIMLSPNPAFQISLPTKFYEYLASKKPLIGVCEGELEDIINSNNIGRTVKPGNAEKLAEYIKDFKNSPDLLQSIEDNCIKTIHKFSLQKIAEDLNQILEKEHNT